jgi:hypothetical protein
VAVAVTIAERLRAMGYEVNIKHRDMSGKYPPESAKASI